MARPVTLRAGTGCVRIYSMRQRGKMRWEVRDHFGGRTNRRKFSDRYTARLYAEERRTMLINGASARFRLSDAQAHDLEKSAEILAPIGKGIVELALEEKARWELRTKQRLCESVPISQIFAEFMEDKRRQGLSPYHLRDLAHQIGRFAQDFQTQINRINGNLLKVWLDGLQVGPRTWNNYRNALLNFFGFAKARKLLPADWDEMDSIRPVAIAERDPEILSPEELQRLLDAASDKLRVQLAIAAFAGIRSEEIARLNWEDFDWESGYIFLRRSIVKGRAAQRKQRQVPISANLADWLGPHRHATGPVSAYKNPKVVAGLKQKLAQKLGVKWKRNALRKSWISYQLALSQDAGKVARWAGNSPVIIAAHYERLVTPEQAAKWFEIRPKSVPQEAIKIQFG